MTLENKTTANLILIIMTLTWSILSIRVGVMVAVSDNFMILAGMLGAGLVGDSAADRLKAWRGGGK
jgi:hypothetical protein